MLGGYIGQSLTAANVTGTVAIANGGTGATTGAAALTNLGALALAGGTMSGQISMGGNSITNLPVIRDNQSPTKIRLSCSGSADTLINDKNGTTQIDVSAGLVTVNNSMAVSGAAAFSSTVTVSNLLRGSGGNAVNTTGVVISGFTPTILYVDGQNGNDGNTGEALNPFQTIGTAVASASSGDLVFVLPGTYAEVDSTQIVLPAGVHLKGAGIDVSIIAPSNTSAVSPFIVLGNGSVVSDLTINTTGGTALPSCIGGLDGNFGLNPSLYRVKAIGPSKALDYQASATSGTSYLYCEDCIFTASFRTAVVTMSPGTLTADFHRCQFIFTYSASVADSSIGECMFIQGKPARLFNCVLSMTDTVNTSWSGCNYQCIDCDNPLELYGTHIITNFPNLPAAPLTTTPGTNPGYFALSNTVVTKIGGGCTISPQNSDIGQSLYQTLPSLAPHSYPLSVPVSSSTATPWGESSNALFEIAVDPAATLTANTLTIANITTSTVPVADGQKMRLRIKNTNSSSTQMTLAFGSTYNSGTISISTIAAGKRAYLDYIYDADNSKWDLTGYVTGI